MDDIDWSFSALATEIAAHTPEAIIVADRDGIIRYWNTGAARIFEYTDDEAVGQSLDIIIPEKHRLAHWTGWQHVIDTGVSRYATDALLSVPGITKSGRRLSLEFSIFVLKGADGTVKAMGATLRDISHHFNKIKELARQLKDAG